MTVYECMLVYMEGKVLHSYSFNSNINHILKSPILHNYFKCYSYNRALERKLSYKKAILDIAVQFV